MYIPCPCRSQSYNLVFITIAPYKLFWYSFFCDQVYLCVVLFYTIARDYTIIIIIIHLVCCLSFYANTRITILILVILLFLCYFFFRNGLGSYSILYDILFFLSFFSFSVYLYEYFIHLSNTYNTIKSTIYNKNTLFSVCFIFVFPLDLLYTFIYICVLTVFHVVCCVSFVSFI